MFRPESSRYTKPLLPPMSASSAPALVSPDQAQLAIAGSEHSRCPVTFRSLKPIESSVPSFMNRRYRLLLRETLEQLALLTIEGIRVWIFCEKVASAKLPSCCTAVSEQKPRSDRNTPCPSICIVKGLAPMLLLPVPAV